jgi:cbb3-type cytochrome oxidase cytochrome c subunit
VPTESPRSRAAHLSLWEGWQGILFVAATYVYFLIFAQFGFLARLGELGIGQGALPAIMGAMAIGGVGMSLLAPRIRLWNCPSCRLQTGFIGCALAALWSLFPLNTFTAAVTALVIGLSVGLLTVTLVANLRLWIGTDRPLLKIGLGTGIAYVICNVPALFTAPPRWIGMVAALGCVLALIVANRSPLMYLPPSAPEPAPARAVSFGLVLTWFTALVWLDSAAFFVIQHSSALKAGAWQGDLHLWRTGVLHLAGALVSAWLLARRGLSVVLAIAIAVLGGACLLLLDPVRVPMAAILYPVGVSLYSVALVAYPSFLIGAATDAIRARRAGYLYAVGGWIGSAMGIGMARNLHQVPPAFVALAAAVFVAPWLWDMIASRRVSKSVQIQALAVVVVVALAIAGTLLMGPLVQPSTEVTGDSAVERGRRVYIAEGCINCHSQYVRPNTADVTMWGPVTNLADIRHEQPPLIGNRRQGPDLSQVGARRSRLWLRIHFMNPRVVSYESPMPRYDYLFRDSRGNDLIAYLLSLCAPGHWKAVAAWRPSAAALAQARQLDGGRLFYEHCATCHAPGGPARWVSGFRRLPPDLSREPLRHVAAQATPSGMATEIARISKFGIEGTDMPGHEYVSDAQASAIANYVVRERGSRGNVAGN